MTFCQHILICTLCLLSGCGAPSEKKTKDDIGDSSSLPGWSSGGGGNVIDDQGNPWFLPNTKTVRFCAIGNWQRFTVKKEVVVNKINEAYGYWQKQFKYVQSLPKLKVATQNLENKECEDDPQLALSRDDIDLVFQFGVLSEKQNQFLKSKRQSIAHTVRTYYDTQNFRGKGFIYISDEETLREEASQAYAADLWNLHSHTLLLRVLIHEFGHVLGLPHFGSTYLDIMGDNYVDFQSRENNARWMAELDVPNVFKPLNRIGEGIVAADSDRLCSTNVAAPIYREEFAQTRIKAQLESWRSAFGIADKFKCIAIQFEGGGFDVYASVDESSRRVHFGRGEILQTSSLMGDAISYIFVPKERRYLSRDDLEFYGIDFNRHLITIPFATRSFYIQKAKFKGPNNYIRQVQIVRKFNNAIFSYVDDQNKLTILSE